MSLYGALDHNAEPAAGELLGPAAPVPTASAPQPEADHDGDEALTARQRRVLRFLAYGLPDDEIAELLSLDEPAVRADVDRIVVVLGAGDRAEAVVRAHHSGALVGARTARVRSAA
jgi:DNA-binding NarL/FixJ family response regulator